MASSFIILIYLNKFVSRMWSCITWHYLHCMLPYSKFCKDCLMMVKSPKHVVTKIKIKLYIVVLTESRHYFVVFWSKNTMWRPLKKENTSDVGSTSAWTVVPSPYLTVALTVVWQFQFYAILTHNEIRQFGL